MGDGSECDHCGRANCDINTCRVVAATLRRMSTEPQGNQLLRDAELNERIARSQGWYKVDTVYVDGRPQIGLFWWHTKYGNPMDPRGNGDFKLKPPNFKLLWDEAQQTIKDLEQFFGEKKEATKSV